jgi:hypothetical protein
VSLACDGASASTLEIFGLTDALVSSLLDALSGSHVELGALEVETDPPGAVVSVNGREVGRSPLVLRSVPAGPVQLIAHAEKYEDATATVQITDGVTERTVLSPAPFPGSISVVTNIAGAHATLGVAVPSPRFCATCETRPWTRDCLWLAYDRTATGRLGSRAASR